MILLRNDIRDPQIAPEESGVLITLVILISFYLLIYSFIYFPILLDICLTPFYEERQVR